MVSVKLSYYPDITQKQKAEDVHAAIITFADASAARLSDLVGAHVTIEVLPVQSVPEQFENIVAGHHHIALMKPVAYVFAHRRDARILPACVAHRPIDGKVGTTYFGQVYAHRRAGIGTMADLIAKPAGELRIAFGDRFSTSNFLIPADILKSAGIHPFLFFRSATFFGGHDRAAEAVYANDADIGCGHDGVIKILAQTHPAAEQDLVTIGRQDIHSDPVVVNTAILPPEISFAMLQTAFSEVAKTAPVQAALDLFWGWVKDLSPTEHQNYASIESALTRLALAESDMLK